MNDEDLMEFIENLDDAASRGVTVTDWEAKFIETMLNPKRGPLTDKHRACIKTMMDRYQHRI